MGVALAAAAVTAGLTAGVVLIIAYDDDSKDDTRSSLPNEASFRRDAESFIEEDGGEVESQLGVTLTDANCAQPPSVDVGTTFGCTAVGSDGTTYD